MKTVPQKIISKHGQNSDAFSVSLANLKSRNNANKQIKPKIDFSTIKLAPSILNPLISDNKQPNFQFCDDGLEDEKRLPLVRKYTSNKVDKYQCEISNNIFSILSDLNDNDEYNMNTIVDNTIVLKSSLLTNLNIEKRVDGIINISDLLDI